MEGVWRRKIATGPWSLPADLAYISDSVLLIGKPAYDLGMHMSEEPGVRGEDFERWRFRPKGQLVADAVSYGDCRVRSMEALVCDAGEEDGEVGETMG